MVYILPLRRIYTCPLRKTLRTAVSPSADMFSTAVAGTNCASRVRSSVAGNLEIYIMPGLMPAKPYTVSWMADGEVIEEQHYAADEALRLPTAAVVACEGMTFIGWTAQANFYDPFATPDDLFTSAETQKVNGNVTYYAVYKQRP